MLTRSARLFRTSKRRLLLFIAVLGPGLITAIADNDAGGVATYSVLGAKFGYTVLFILFLSSILLVVTQEIGARLSVISGRGLGDLIREEYGIKTSLFVFLILSLANMGTTVANLAGFKAGLTLFQLPHLPYLILFIVLCVIFIYRGSYNINQRIFLFVCFFYLTYLFSAVLAGPDWNKSLRSFFIPTNIPMSFDFLFGSVALLGTTVTPWGQFFISSFIKDKRLTVDKLKYVRVEVYAGSAITALFSAFIIIAVSATLYKHGILIKTAEDAALAISPFAGQFATFLFGVGLIAASFMGAVIVPLTTAYAFSEFFGYEGSLDLPFNKSKNFYLLFLIQIVVAAAVVLFPVAHLFKIVLFTQSLNGVLLPIILYFLMKFANSSEIMGSHANNKFYNYFTWSAMIVIVISSLLVVFGAIFGKI